MKLKILMLPDKTYPTSHAVLEEVYANILHSKGHEIIWVMQSSEKLKKNKIVDWRGSIVYVTMASPGTSRFGRLINHILRFIGKAIVIREILKKEKFDLVQVRTGIIEGILAVYLKKRYGIPFSFQYSSPCGGSIYASKSGMARYPLIYYVRGIISQPILAWLMAKADLILPISKWMKRDLIKKGIPEEKMMIFPLGADATLSPKKISGKRIRKKFEIGVSPTIIYLGTMNRVRELDFLLRVLMKVKKEIYNVKLLMVGDGDDRSRLEKLSKSLGIEENIIFTGQVPRSRVPEFIASANIGVSPIPPVPIYQVSSPTKLIEYMAMGKTVVANCEIPDQKEVVKESGGGICVRYDEEKFAEAMIELLNNPKERKEMGKKGRDWVVKNRSYEILAREIEERYFDLVSKNS